MKPRAVALILALALGLLAAPLPVEAQTHDAVRVVKDPIFSQGVSTHARDHLPRQDFWRVNAEEDISFLV